MIIALHGPPTLADRPMFVSALKSIQILSDFKKDQLLVTSVFLFFYRTHIRVLNLPERSDTSLLTGSDQTVLAVRSCEGWV